jgi:hypothetical protein
MGALPVFDERRGEYVPAAPAASNAAAPAVERSAEELPAADRPLGPERRGRVAVFQACLGRLKQSLEAGGNGEDAALLGEIIEFLATREAPAPKPAAPADPDHQPIFAVCAAFIDAQASMSVDETVAAQALARKLVIQGYELPKHGGDTRGWKRLLLWRDQLVRGRLPDMRETYERALHFARQAPMAMDLKAAMDYALDPRSPK